MKVLFIVTSFQRSENDVITPWMVETVDRLRRAGVAVSVYVCSWKGMGDHEIRGIPVRRFRYFWRRWETLSHDETVPDQIRRNKLFALLVAPYMLFVVLGLWKLLRRERFDIIHVHWPFPHGIFGWFARRWSGAPVVCQFHGVELRWVRNKMPLFLPLLRRILRTSQLVVANSSHTRAEIRSLEPCRVEIVPYGSPLPEAVEAPPASKDPGRTRRVLFVGRLVERKGVAYLIRAMKKLDCPFRVELEVVGSGPEEEALRALAGNLGLEDRVFLRGKVPSAELHRYYAACDCFVLPAVTDSKGDTEGLGVVLIEALTYRKAVVASSVGGIVDVIHDNQTGLLVPEKDPGELALAIARVLKDEVLAGRLGEQGYSFVKRYFDWERLIGRWIELYRELAPAAE